MTDCEQIQAILSAWIDGELTTDEASKCSSHLQTCDTCRRELESLQEIDGQLKQCLVLSNVDDKCDAIAQYAHIQAMPTDHTARWTLAGWLPILVAIAAVLLLAIFPMPWSKESIGTQVYQDTEVARLVRSTGPVQVLVPGAASWAELSADSSCSLVAGSRLKTLNAAVCQLETTSKGIIRLNTSAELILRDPNQFELVSGQLWCLTPEDCEIEVNVAITEVPSIMLATLACPSGSEMQCEAGTQRAYCDSLSPANSLACVTFGGFSCDVAPGELVSVDADNRVNRTTSNDPTTRLWQLPLLATDGVVSQELVSLLTHVLAPIGMSKAMHLNERQIRQLGSPAAIPLLAYAATESAPESLALRQTAMRLAADMADKHAIALLESLLSDPDAYIAELAKTTLTRVVQSD